MNKLHKFSLEELVDLLSTQTSLFIQMQTTGATEIEYENCRQLILDLQEEIEFRKKEILL